MELRVVSWNIHKGRDFLGRRVDIQHSFDLMVKQEWDVCCLQEVPRHAIQAFAHRSGMSFAYGATRPIRGGDHVGNVVLIRRGSIDEVANLDISAHAIESRGALFARVCLPTHPSIIISSTHFGLTRHWRDRQSREWLRFVDKSAQGDASGWSRVVVGGDFNDYASGVLNAMRLHGFNPPHHFLGRSSSSSFPSIAPVLSLDCIYFRGGGRSLGGGVLNRGAGWHRHSDHLPIFAHIDFTATDDYFNRSPPS